MTPLWGSQQPPPNPSRHCNPCHLIWPNDHRMTSCPICDNPTQLSDEDHGFRSVSDALVFAAVQRNKADNLKRFDAYCKARDAKLILEAIAELESHDEHTLAAQFAKLMENPTKEVANGSE